jgi:calcineurin-like phosphoesterase
MKILILGDLMGNSGKKSLKENLEKIVKDNKIDFTILNGENAAEDGKGITKDIAEELQISKRTAEVHRFNLMKKLEAKNLMELTNKAKEYKLTLVFL